MCLDAASAVACFFPFRASSVDDGRKPGSVGLASAIKEEFNIKLDSTGLVCLFRSTVMKKLIFAVAALAAVAGASLIATQAMAIPPACQECVGY